MKRRRLTEKEKAERRRLRMIDRIKRSMREDAAVFEAMSSAEGTQSPEFLAQVAAWAERDKRTPGKFIEGALERHRVRTELHREWGCVPDCLKD